MGWSDTTSATQLTSITTEQFFDETPELNPGETAHVQVTVDFPGSPTDDAIISVYGTLDDSTYDDTALLSFQLDNGTDPHVISFTVSGVFQFRVGVQRTGSTDTLTDADMSFRLDRADL